jgi:hypothetical protein
VESITSPEVGDNRFNLVEPSFLTLDDVAHRVFPDDGVSCRGLSKLGKKAWNEDGTPAKNLETFGGFPGIQAATTELIGTTDFYWSPNEYFGFRDSLKKPNGLARIMGLGERNLARIHTLVADIDTHKVNPTPPLSLLPEILKDLSEQTAPLPHMAVLSGRGLHLYWLIEPSAREDREKEFWADVRVWKAAARKISWLLEKWGSDWGATTRPGGYFRVPGSQNSSAPGAPVGAIEILPAAQSRYRLEELANAIPVVKVGTTKRRHKSIKTTVGVCPSLAHTKGFLALRDARAYDIDTIIDDRISRGYDWEGLRNKVCFHWGQTRSNYDLKEGKTSLLQLNRRLCKTDTPANETNIKHVSYPHFTLEKKKFVYLYRLTNTRIIQELEITEDEMVRLQLRTLISPKVKWARRKSKMEPKPDGRTERTRISLEKIEAARATGAKTSKEIQQYTGLSRAQVSRLINRKPSEQSGEPVPQAAPEVLAAPSASKPTRLPRPPPAGARPSECKKAPLTWNFDSGKEVRLTSNAHGLALDQPSTESHWILTADSDPVMIGKVQGLLDSPGSSFTSFDSLPVLRDLEIRGMGRPSVLNDLSLAANLLGVDPRKKSTSSSKGDGSWTWVEMEALLETEGILQAYLHREIAVRDIVFEMELNGLPFDRAAADEYQDILHQALNDVERKIQDIVGFPLNVSDDRKVAGILRGLFPQNKVPRKKGKESWDKATLQNLRGHSDLPALIIRYRAIRAGLKSSLFALLRNVSDDGRVRGSYSVLDTVTGRISCHEPNLMGIPKEALEGIKIRKTIRTPIDRTLVRGDFRQFELCLVAQASGCVGLVQLLQAGGDLYLNIAREMFPAGDKRELAKLREAAKEICYLIVYGGQAVSLARSLGVSIPEAEEYLNGFHSLFPEIRGFAESLLLEAQDSNSIRTLGGRRRMLPNLRASQDQLRRTEERKVLSTFIQGTAAEIIKDAMILVTDQISNLGSDSQLVLQVHDELILEVPLWEEKIWAENLREAMTTAAMEMGFQVPVRVTFGPDLA